VSALNFCRSHRVGSGDSKAELDEIIRQSVALWK
jgi:hypothetical protein